MPRGIRKRFDLCKFNRLSTNVLNAIFKRCGEIDTLSHGGTYGNLLSAPARLTVGDKRLIFSGLKRNLAAWGYFWKKVKRDGESLASSSVNGQDRGT